MRDLGTSRPTARDEFREESKGETSRDDPPLSTRVSGEGVVVGVSKVSLLSKELLR